MPSPASNFVTLPAVGITRLDLSSRAFKARDLKTLGISKFRKLEQLDVSDNKLDTFPDDMTLDRLRTLNCSENRLRCLKFVKQFPNLEELSVEMNLININDEYIAVHMLPKLQQYNGHSTDQVRNTIEQYEHKLSAKLRKVWREKYEEKFSDVSTLLETNRIEKSIKRELQTVSCGPASLQHFKDYLIAHLVKEFMVEATEEKQDKKQTSNIRKSIGEPPRKKQRCDKVTKSQGEHRLSKKTKMKGDGLKYDYVPAHFLRCHSKNNDPEDENTKVWRCVFEPNPTFPGETTDTVATCGGEAVCLIDCKSGKVMKKYKQTNEDFYAIGWTTVSMEVGGKRQATNLLAAGGKNGEIRLMYPSQLSCYSNTTTGKGPINALLFHPSEPTHLFSGSHEVVQLWDIGIPKLANYECHPKQLCQFEAVSSVLNLVVLPKIGRLLGACEDGIYGWDLHSKSYAKKRLVTKEYLLPSCGRGEKVFVDGLALIQDDIIATKFCRETEDAYESDNRILVWSITETERQHSKKSSDFEIVPVKLLHTLEWKHLNEIYLYLGNHKDCGVLASGDDMGNVHLYDMSKVKSSANIRASQVLSWPSPEETGESVLIDDIDISSDLKTIIAVTHNNIICVWKAT